MEHIIVYGSQYGSTRRYAEKLSEQTGIPATRYQDAPALSNRKTIVYLGGLYAGGVLGLAKTLRGFSLRAGQKLLLVTVGLADPNDQENRDNIRATLQKQLPAGLLDRAKVYHLRKTPPEQQTAENRAFLETYGKQVDFTDFRTLEPIILEIQKEAL